MTENPPPAKKPSLDVGEGLAALVIAGVSLYLLQAGKLEGWHFYAACFMFLAAVAGITRFVERLIARRRGS